MSTREGRDSPPSASRAPAVRAGAGREHRATWSLPSWSACPRRGRAAGCGKPGALCVRLCGIYGFILRRDRRPLPRPASDKQPRPGREHALSWPLFSWGVASTCGARTGPCLPPPPFQPVQVLLGLHALMLDTLAICCLGVGAWD